MDKRITLRHLEAFRAIMVRKTVTGAAEMLGVTQPVVTRLISDLEERIAIELFRRNKGRLVATPEASLLFEDVHQCLIGVERIANAASNIKALKMGHLEIAAAPAMALSFLPHAIANFTKEHPDTLVSMHMHGTPTVLDMVQSRRCDIGFAMLPMRTTRHGNSEVLLSARMVGAVPVHHHLARRKVLHPEDFEGENFISMPPLMETRTKIDSLFLSYGIHRRINIETQISFALIKLVEAGAGLSIVDPLTASGYADSLVKFIPFEPEIINDYSIVLSARNDSTLILKPFIDHARKEIRKMVPHQWIVQAY
ncbi:LysR family transcriptional regulator [Corticibacter populi]|uniref:LysR family transcriptional regulator n=1 Tax=Corticibacter populi TaxID=1550736 RepID=A0A3M6QKE2_9BURK|nr:LysR substrate-binding domain-containing protein [Corticibacter populi]RMX03503.1 LysR family transcriptional regulator [Corticibacter populi]RZS29948.1 LysR family transcriptional regulator [Corticibacter populi]